MGLCLAAGASYSNAFAWDRGGGSHGHEREVVVVGHDRYHYRDGRFYRPGWFGFEFSVVVPPVGVVVSALPMGYGTIIVGGAPYYYYDNIYYTRVPSGYMVVQRPVVPPVVVSPPPPVIQPQMPSGETVTINVPNSNGSYTPVTLVRRNNGYVGPQGEYYPTHPTVDQLKALYGR